MKFIGYIIAYSLLWLISRLPQKGLFFISDFFYLVVYYIIGYRKKVVYKNLSLAFPEYSKKQIRSTAKKFYRHFCDVILESAVTPFTSDRRISMKLSYKNPELIERLYKEGKFLIGIGAHYGNWEVLMHLEKKFPYPFVAIYKPLRNEYFDRLLRRSRARYGSILVAMQRVGRTLMEFKKNTKYLNNKPSNQSLHKDCQH